MSWFSKSEVENKPLVGVFNLTIQQMMTEMGFRGHCADNLSTLYVIEWHYSNYKLLKDEISGLKESIKLLEDRLKED